MGTDSHRLLGEEIRLVAPTLFYNALEDQYDPRADLYLRRMPSLTELVPKGKQRLLEESDFPCCPRMRLHVDCTGRVCIADETGGQEGQGPVTCLVTVVKPDKSDLRRGVFAWAHSSKIRSTRQVWQQEEERRPYGTPSQQTGPHPLSIWGCSHPR